MFFKKDKKNSEESLDLARTILRAVCGAFSLVQERQYHLLQDQGYTKSQRFHLSISLAGNLYREGIYGITRRQLKECLTEGELQTILWMLLSNVPEESVIDTMSHRLCQRPEFQSYAKNTSPSRLSQVQQERSFTCYRTSERSKGSRRDIAGRSGWSYHRSVSEP